MVRLHSPCRQHPPPRPRAPHPKKLAAAMLPKNSVLPMALTRRPAAVDSSASAPAAAPADSAAAAATGSASGGRPTLPKILLACGDSACSWLSREAELLWVASLRGGGRRGTGRVAGGAACRRRRRAHATSAPCVGACCPGIPAASVANPVQIVQPL